MTAILRRFLFRSSQPSPEKQAERDEKDRIIEKHLEKNRIERREVKEEAGRYVSTLNEAMWIIGGRYDPSRPSK